VLRYFSRALRLRPGSYPFISGDDFRLLADHIFNEHTKCSSNNIQKDGEIIFVKTDLIYDWFEIIHPEIKHRYKLITHNSDFIIDEKAASYVDDKIISWFALNNTYRHKKIITIPNGIENMKWFMSGWTFRRKAKEFKNPISKNRILYGFNIKNNPNERKEAENYFMQSKVADGIEGRLGPEEYFDLLKDYKFVASPEGNGPDCHRTWEAIGLKNSTGRQEFLKKSDISPISIAGSID